MDESVTLSIVVCTFNRAELLSHCLASLVVQVAAQPAAELIVVDNASTDDTQVTAAAALAGLARARVVHEPKQGLSHARNRGIAEARGTWVAYIDDDAVARSGWLARALQTLATEQFDALGGVYLPWYRYGRPSWFRDEYASNAGQRDTVGLLDEHRFCSGGNCIFRRDVLRALGGFPVAIGMRGQTRSFGEETLVQVRMRQRGLRIGFDPELIVDHLVAPQKMSVARLLRDNFRAGLDSWRAFALRPSLAARLRVAATGLVHVPTRLPAALAQLARGGYYVQNMIVDVCGSPAYNLGQLLAARDSAP